MSEQDKPKSPKETIYIRRGDNRQPFVTAYLCSRPDPKSAHLTNVRCAAGVSWALNVDEARGMTMRKGAEIWPADDGWTVISIGVGGLSAGECEEIARMVGESSDGEKAAPVPGKTAKAEDGPKIGNGASRSAAAQPQVKIGDLGQYLDDERKRNNATADRLARAEVVVNKIREMHDAKLLMLPDWLESEMLDLTKALDNVPKETKPQTPGEYLAWSAMADSLKRPMR